MLKFDMKLRAFLVGYLLVICSMFIGQGYNPVFAVISLVEPSLSFFSLLCYVGFTLLKSLGDWSVQGIAGTDLVFQAVMMLMGYIPLMFLPRLRRSVKSRTFKSGFTLTIASATFYWWASNSLCFTQMSGLIPSWKAYDFSLFGYVVCLLSGGTFYLHSLAVSIPAYILLYIFGRTKFLSLNESLSYARS